MRRLTKITLNQDDYMFFLKNSFVSSEPFVRSLGKLLEMKLFTGASDEYKPQVGQKLLFGSEQLWLDLIYPQLDPNPLNGVLIQYPHRHVLENYFCLAYGINSSLDEIHIDGKPKFTIQEFLSCNEFEKFIDNPQSNRLISMNNAWMDEASLLALSAVAKEKLLAEKLDQFSFVGLIDFFELSMSLAEYTFTGKITTRIWKNNQYSKIMSLYPSIPFEIIAQIQERNQADNRLYSFAREKFFTNINEMIHRLEDNQTAKNDVGIIVLDPEVNFTKRELKIIGFFRKIKKMLFDLFG